MYTATRILGLTLTATALAAGPALAQHGHGQGHQSSAHHGSMGHSPHAGHGGSMMHPPAQHTGHGGWGGHAGANHASAGHGSAHTGRQPQTHPGSHGSASHQHHAGSGGKPPSAGGKAHGSTTVRVNINVRAVRTGRVSRDVVGTSRVRWVGAGLVPAGVPSGDAVAAVQAAPVVDDGPAPTPAAPSLGVRVSEIYPGWPADRGGLRAGDVVVSVDGTRVASVDDIRAALAGKPAVEMTFRNSENGQMEFTRVAPRDGLIGLNGEPVELID
jgi:hypothetical protein